MSNWLEGKIAVITGGTEGIGFTTAKLFVKEGAYVFITGRRRKELDEAPKAIGSDVFGVQGDVAKLADLDRFYETVAKVKRRIDNQRHCKRGLRAAAVQLGRTWKCRAVACGYPRAVCGVISVDL